MNNLEIKGTVFWLIVSAVLVIATIELNNAFTVVSGVIVAALYSALAFACWRMKKWGFIGALALALFTIVASIAFAFIVLQAGAMVIALDANAFMIIPQLLIIFYSIQAYRSLYSKSSAIAG